MNGKDCTEAVYAYLEDLAACLRTGRLRVAMLEDERWSRDSDSVARRHVVKYPLISQVLNQHKSTSPKYTAAQEAIREDSDFGPVVGWLIGSTTGASRFDEDTVIAYAFRGAVDENATVCMTRDRVQQNVRLLGEYVRADTRTCTVLVPLPGLTGSCLPCSLDDGIQIDNFTDAEIDAGASLGIIRPVFPTMPILRTEDCVGARIKISLDAYRRPAEAESGLTIPQAELAQPHRFGDRKHWRYGEIAEDVLFALRLARPEYIGAVGVVLMQPGLAGSSRSWMTRPSRRQIVHSSYVLDEETAQTVRTLWSTLTARAGRKKSLPHICGRRFNTALDNSLEDAIIDYMICAEALFLKDVGSPEDRGELGFRLSLRAAVLLEETGIDRRSAFTLIKKAYNLRSTIAHGGTAPTTVKVAGRDEMPLGEFVEELNGLIREALRKAVELYPIEPKFGTAAYWDERLLGPSHTPAGS